MTETVAAHVLVVDDDPVMRELLGMLLTLNGHTVETASSGTEALDRLQEILAALPPTGCEIVLMDLQMPGIAGARLVKALRALRQPSVVLIGMSGALPEPEVLALFDAFLRKPFHGEEFDAAIRQVRKKRAERTQAGGATAVADSGAAIVAEDAGGSGREIFHESTIQQLAAMLPIAQLRELFRITLDDVGLRHARMAAYAAAGDLKAVQREAHAVKGACGMVGAKELQTLAARVERGSDLGNLPLEEFPAACLRLRRMLDVRLKND